MPKINKCNVKGCLNESKKDPIPRSLHTVPPTTKKKLRRRWLEILKVPYHPDYKSFVVCSCHFKKEDFFPSKIFFNNKILDNCSCNFRKNWSKIEEIKTNGSSIN